MNLDEVLFVVLLLAAREDFLLLVSTRVGELHLYLIFLCTEICHFGALVNNFTRLLVKIRLFWRRLRYFALDLDEEGSLEYDIPCKCESALKCQLDCFQFLFLGCKRPTETDRAT